MPPAPAPGLLRRLFAMGYESLIVLALLVVALLLPHLLVGVYAHRIARPFVLWAHLFATLAVYFVWFWSAGRQTLAMKTWRIRLVLQNGEPLPPRRALLRYLLSWPSLLLCGIGVLWALVDRDRQFLHDRIAGTFLVSDATASRSAPLDPPDHSGRGQQEQR